MGLFDIFKARKGCSLLENILDESGYPDDFKHVITQSLIKEDFTCGKKVVPSELSYITEFFIKISNDCNAQTLKFSTSDIASEFKNSKDPYLYILQMYNNESAFQFMTVLPLMLTSSLNIFNKNIDIQALSRAIDFQAYCLGLYIHFAKFLKLIDKYPIDNEGFLRLCGCIHSVYHSENLDYKEHFYENFLQIINNQSKIQNIKEGRFELQALMIGRGYTFYPKTLASLSEKFS